MGRAEPVMPEPASPSRWLSIVGVGEDGVEGLSATARGLIATAEGVETVEQLRAVQELGCDLVQGYLISPPMEPSALPGWKKEFRKRWPALIADDNLALWSDVEADALGQR